MVRIGSGLQSTVWQPAETTVLRSAIGGKKLTRRVNLHSLGSSVHDSCSAVVGHSQKL